MADEPREGNGGVRRAVVPSASEQLHLPGPSYLPVIVAFGVTIALVGVIISYILVAAGLIITAVAIVRWVRETREEIAELPLEH